MFIPWHTFSINIIEVSNCVFHKQWTLQTDCSQFACLSQALLHFESALTWVSLCLHHRSRSLYKNCIRLRCKCAEPERGSQKAGCYLFSLGIENPTAHPMIIVAFPSSLAWIFHALTSSEVLHACCSHDCISNALVCTNFTMLKNTTISRDCKCYIKFIFKEKHFSIFQYCECNIRLINI